MVSTISRRECIHQTTLNCNITPNIMQFDLAATVSRRENGSCAAACSRGIYTVQLRQLMIHYNLALHVHLLGMYCSKTTRGVKRCNTEVLIIVDLHMKITTRIRRMCYNAMMSTENCTTINYYVFIILPGVLIIALTRTLYNGCYTPPSTHSYFLLQHCT